MALSSLKKKVYTFARDRMPHVVARALQLPLRFLPQKQQQLYLLAVEEQVSLLRRQLWQQQQCWQAWLQLAPQADSVLLVCGAHEHGWAQNISQILKRKKVQVTQVTLSSAIRGLDSEQRFPLLLRGMDWNEQPFPSATFFPLALISPAIATLAHRPAFLLWLEQRYRVHHFLLRLPMICRHEDRVFRSQYGAPLTEQRAAPQGALYQVLYTERSARSEFSYWFQVEHLQIAHSVGEIWTRIGSSIRISQEERVSVVIPAYKAEAFLPSCLQSLIQQSWARLDIMVIDDASPDSSGQIVQQFSQRDPRIRLIKQPHNQGQAAARNLGLEQAKGAYICFVDADDFVHPRYVETLVLALRQSEADFVVCELDEAHDPGPSIHCYRSWTKTDAAPLPFESPYLKNAPWDKMFRTSVLRAQRITFPQGHYYEDLPFTHALASKTHRHFYLPLTMVHYRHHHQSESRATLQEKNIIDHCTAIAAVQSDLFTRSLLSQPATVARYWQLVVHHIRKLLGADMLGQSGLPPARRCALAVLAWQHTLPLWRLNSPDYRRLAPDLFTLSTRATQPLQQLQELAPLIEQLRQRQLSRTDLPDVFPQYW